MGLYGLAYQSIKEKREIFKNGAVFVNDVKDVVLSKENKRKIVELGEINDPFFYLIYR